MLKRATVLTAFESTSLLQCDESALADGSPGLVTRRASPPSRESRGCPASKRCTRVLRRTAKGPLGASSILARREQIAGTGGDNEKGPSSALFLIACELSRAARPPNIYLRAG